MKYLYFLPLVIAFVILNIHLYKYKTTGYGNDLLVALAIIMDTIIGLSLIIVPTMMGLSKF